MLLLACWSAMLLALGLGAAASSERGRQGGNEERADGDEERAFAGLDALMAIFWSKENGYLMEEVPSTSGPQ